MSEPRTLWRVRVILGVTAALLFTISAVIQWAQGSVGRATFVSAAAVACAASTYLQWRMRKSR
jgi:hypothetical protein